MMVELNDLVGKQFEDGGRGPDSFDCWGLTIEIYRRFGYVLPNYSISAYACEQVYNEIQGAKINNNWIELDTPEIPCVVLIKAHPAFYQHLGVYIGNGQILHAMSYGIEKIKRTHPNWKKRIKGYWQYATVYNS